MTSYCSAPLVSPRWLLLLALLLGGCGPSDVNERGAFVDADADRAITPGELEPHVASQEVAVRLVAACDAPHTRDGRLSTSGEIACLEGQPIGGGAAIRVRDAIQQPILSPQPATLTVLVLALAVALLAPALASRTVRAAGWRFRSRTRAAWFRLPPFYQLLLSVLAGVVASAAALMLLIVLHVGWRSLAAWIGFLNAGLWFVAILATVGLLAALLAGLTTVGASRRLLQLEAAAGHPVPPNPPRSSPKNIVVCCDGTGNTPRAAEDGRPAMSNVARFYDRVVGSDACAWRQSKWYDDGVGTSTSGVSRRVSRLGRMAAWVGAKTPARVLGIAEKFRMIKELGFGIGITENISQGYREIVRQYQPGDRIFLVGFSRGAYTARCIADVIDDIGLLRSEHIRFAFDVVQFYRYRNSTADPVRLDPRLMHDDVQVEFLGLWDTVASLGVPLWGWSYSIGGLWSNQGMGVTDIKNCRAVRHALSMDEERSQFFPTLFDERPDLDIEQRWFRGAHAGVGGGYADTSLSDISLIWMIEEAQKRGLSFVPDWRADLSPNPHGQVITQLERQRAWRMSGTWPRWHPCESKVSRGFGAVDASVYERAKLARSCRLTEGAVSSDELLTLAPGDSAVVRIRADLTWHRTGVVMEHGARYRFTYLHGTWRDKEAPLCGPSGQLATGSDVRRLMGRGKRVVGARWMELIGHVAHPRRWEQRELGASDLLRHLLVEDPPELTATLIPLGRHLHGPRASVDVEVQSPSGVFYAFANDWWLFYDNNSGAATLQVTRLAGDAGRVPFYLVTPSGEIQFVEHSSRDGSVSVAGTDRAPMAGSSSARAANHQAAAGGSTVEVRRTVSTVAGPETGSER